MRAIRSLGSLLLLAVLPPFQGGDRPDRPDRDPPSRVGRLSYLSGPVSFRPGDVDDWTDATISYPLHNGDHLWTDSDARAEITVGSSAFRLAPQSAFGFLALDDRTVQVRLSQGSLNVRVRDLAESESLEIDTPSGAVTLLRSGVYRIDVDSTGDTTSVTVRRGEAEVTASGSAFPVHPEQTAMVVGGDSPTYDVRDAIRSDDWEDWCASRDRRWDDARSSRYVSRDVIGYEDLDDNGEWRTTPDYGPVWVPRTVATGWAPYRYGHWAWVEPWGWVPGRVVARPVYAPALVVFVGGRNWSVAIGAGGGGGVAWFPLAPEEPYYPAYHVSNTYVRNVNVTNVNVTNINVTNVNVTNINYRNRRAPDAVTVVSHDAFVQSRPVNRSVIAVARDRLDQARVVGFAARVTPTRQSVLAQPTVVEARRPPERVTAREVIVRRQPAAAPVPFAAREQALAAHPGRPLDNTTMRALRTSTPNANARPFVRPAIPEQRGQTPAPALRPAREGLVVAQPERRQPSAPVATPVRQAAPRGADQRGNRPDRGKPPEERPSPSTRQKRADRPTPSTAPAPAPERQKAEPQRQQPERRPAAQQPAKERKAERDTTK